jgi:hypothetical protein
LESGFLGSSTQVRNAKEELRWGGLTVRKAPSIMRGIHLPCLEEYKPHYPPRFLSEAASHRAEGVCRRTMDYIFLAGIGVPDPQ